MPGVLHLLPGSEGGGKVGARLVADKRVAGVAFTGSSETAALIQQGLARRGGRSDRPVNRRDQRHERDDRRFLRTPRAGRARYRNVGLRPAPAALLGAFRVLICKTTSPIAC
ncbi:MAG: aldehyde dehydrogenase family protein [Hyphomicrobiaceae bacterium]